MTLLQQISKDLNASGPKTEKEEINVFFALFLGWKLHICSNYPEQMWEPGTDGTYVKNCPDFYSHLEEIKIAINNVVSKNRIEQLENKIKELSGGISAEQLQVLLQKQKDKEQDIQNFRYLLSDVLGYCKYNNDLVNKQRKLNGEDYAVFCLNQLVELFEKIVKE